MPYRRLARFIDDPPYFLFWPFPEAATMISAIVLGLLFGGFIWFTLAGTAITYLLRKYNAKQKPGYMMHFLYAVGMVYTKNKTLPNPYIRSFH